MDPILGMGYHKDPDSWYVPAEHDASIPRYYRYTERMLCTCLYGMFSCVRSRLGYQCHTCGGWSWSRETIAMDIYHERRPACRGCGQRSGGAHLTSCPDQNVFDPMGHIVR